MWNPLHGTKSWLKSPTSLVGQCLGITHTTWTKMQLALLNLVFWLSKRPNFKHFFWFGFACCGGSILHPKMAGEPKPEKKVKHISPRKPTEYVFTESQQHGWNGSSDYLPWKLRWFSPGWMPKLLSLILTLPLYGASLQWWWLVGLWCTPPGLWDRTASCCPTRGLHGRPKWFTSLLLSKLSFLGLLMWSATWLLC